MFMTVTCGGMLLLFYDYLFFSTSKITLLYDQYDPFSQCSQPAAVLQLPGRVHASVGRTSFLHAMQSRNVVLLHAKVTVQ